MSTTGIVILFMAIVAGILGPLFKRFFQKRGHAVSKPRAYGRFMSYWYPALGFIASCVALISYWFLAAGYQFAGLTITAELGEALTRALIEFMWFPIIVFLLIFGFLAALIATERGVIQARWMKRLVGVR